MTLSAVPFKQADGVTTDYAGALGSGILTDPRRFARTVQDGDDVCQGATTDAAVTGDNPGSLSAKLRGLGKLWASVWDSVNGRLKVDGSQVTQPVSQAGPWSASLSGTLPAGNNTLGIVYAAPSGVQSVQQSGPWSASISGSLPAGTNNLGTVGLQAQSTGGATPYPPVISLASDNATSVKAVPGNLFSVAIFNYNTTACRYVKFYDKASVPVPTGDASLLRKIFPVPMATNANTPGGVVISGQGAGAGFLNGLGFAIVANPGYTDDTPVGSGDVILNFDYR